MTLNDAKSIRERYVYEDNLSEEDFFLYSEAMDYLIEQTKDPECMLELGILYNCRQDYNMALKYLEMAHSYGSSFANLCLGYIWMYGQTGEFDYKKAYDYFSAIPDNVNARYKIADMYKNGFYVEADQGKYKEIIEELYEQTKNDYDNYHSCNAEISLRLAEIRADEGKNEIAVNLYHKAKNIMSERIMYDTFYGHFDVMKRIVEGLYQLKEIDPDNIDFYDLFELLKKPIKIGFQSNDDDKEHIVEAVEEDGEVIISFEGKWYRTVDDFFKKAEIHGERLVSISLGLYDFEVI